MVRKEKKIFCHCSFEGKAITHTMVYAPLPSVTNEFLAQLVKIFILVIDQIREDFGEHFDISHEGSIVGTQSARLRQRNRNIKRFRQNRAVGFCHSSRFPTDRIVDFGPRPRKIFASPRRRNWSSRRRRRRCNGITGIGQQGYCRHCQRRYLHFEMDCCTIFVSFGCGFEVASRGPFNDTTKKIAFLIFQKRFVSKIVGSSRQNHNRSEPPCRREMWKHSR